MATLRRVPGAGREILDKALVDLNKTSAKVGWFETSRYPDANATPVAYVAAIQELGPHARPFMRPTADERDKEWAALMLQLSRQIVKGNMTVHEAMSAIGLQAEGDIRRTITRINAPPLSLITLMARKARLDGKKVTGATIGEFAARIAAEGEAAIRAEVAGISTKPLNDTGYMLATLTHVVEDGK